MVGITVNEALTHDFVILNIYFYYSCKKVIYIAEARKVRYIVNITTDNLV